MLVNIIYAMYAKFQSSLYSLFASNLEHLIRANLQCSPVQRFELNWCCSLQPSVNRAGLSSTGLIMVQVKSFILFKGKHGCHT